jgi:hypothetical protein
MRKEQREAAKNYLKEHLFKAKYFGILLMKNNIVWKVVAVDFDTTKENWFLTASQSTQDEYDDRIYVLDPTSSDTITVFVIPGKNGPSPLIKAFNDK